MGRILGSCPSHSWSRHRMPCDWLPHIMVVLSDINGAFFRHHLLNQCVQLQPDCEVTPNIGIMFTAPIFGCSTKESPCQDTMDPCTIIKTTFQSCTSSGLAHKVELLDSRKVIFSYGIAHFLDIQACMFVIFTSSWTLQFFVWLLDRGIQLPGCHPLSGVSILVIMETIFPFLHQT